MTSELAGSTGLPSDRGSKDLGIFLPMANGGWILSSTTPPLDGSYAYNKRAAVLAEEIGLDFVMAMAKWRGYGGARNHWGTALESQIMMAGIAEATSRVKIWATVHTLLQNPAVTAKMIATLDQISNGRAGLNIVTGAYRGEFAQMGAWPENVGHDARYDLATEWTTIVKRLWSEPSVTFNGAYFTMDDCQSEPKPVAKPRPFLVCAGMSERGMRFTAEHTDAIFLGGRDQAELKAASRTAKAIAADLGTSLKTYAMCTVIFGQDDQEAQAKLAHYREGFDAEAFAGMMRSYGFLDAEIGAENSFVAKARSALMTLGVVGGPRTVTNQIIDMIEGADLDGVMLIFDDYIKGLEIFGAEVLAPLRARFGG